MATSGTAGVGSKRRRPQEPVIAAPEGEEKSAAISKRIRDLERFLKQAVSYPVGWWVGG